MDSKYSFVSFGSIVLNSQESQAEQLDKVALNALRNTRIFTNIGTSELFENGISVFKADESGLPIVENIIQARLLAEKIGYTAYGLNGKIIGEGRSEEPIITDISGEQIDIAAETLQGIVIDYLASKYEASGAKDESENQNTIFSFYDMNEHKHYLKYMGIRFD